MIYAKSHFGLDTDMFVRTQMKQAQIPGTLKSNKIQWIGIVIYII